MIQEQNQFNYLESDPNKAEQIAAKVSIAAFA